MSATTAGAWDDELTSRNSTDTVSSNGFAIYYDLYKPLLPFADRRTDPVVELDAVRERLDELPPTAGSLTSRQITSNVPDEMSPMYFIYPELVRPLGVWTYIAAKGRRYVNPGYVHRRSAPPSVTDADKRYRIVRQAAAVGVLDRDHLGDRFGIVKDSVTQWCKRNDVPWEDWRDAGKSRITRTIMTAAAWHDEYSQGDIRRIIGLPESTYRTWRGRYADGWDVPPDPSDEIWFDGRTAQPIESVDELRRVVDVYGGVSTANDVPRCEVMW